MAEVLAEFPKSVADDRGTRYRVRACAAPASDGRAWQCWIEFAPLGGGLALRTTRETMQPNRRDAVYWATGLTPIYLEGALDRALRPGALLHPRDPVPPAFEAPAPASRVASGFAAAQQAALDPFEIFEREGEPVLRRRLSALAPWRLVRIIRTYGLASASAESEPLPRAALAERIIDAVRDAHARVGARR
ncbi:MAG: hypothetical protein IT176_09015 [Acidobacteria bacterium]|nr:hypothetical protein [Acidobacteriota bacterium]